jgi:hypothetical protein
MTDASNDLYSPESWEQAKRMAGLVGEIPSVFSTCIRFFRIDAERNKGILTPSSRYCFARLIDSPSMSAALYFAARTYRATSLLSLPELRPRDLMDLFKADELAAIVAALYLQRRIERGCPATEWINLLPNMTLYSEVGGHVGQAIPKIGFAFGLLLGTFRHLTLALMMGIDEKKFIAYRRHLKFTGAPFELSMEQQLWGTTHPQLASMLLQVMGLGTGYFEAVVAGLYPGKIQDTTQTEHAYLGRVTALWIDTLVATGSIPNIVHRGQYYPLGTELDVLLSTVASLRKEGSQFRWLTRNRADLGPHLDPPLTLTRAGEAVDLEAEESAVPEEVRQELADAAAAELE